jgi:hypothetical protein
MKSLFVSCLLSALTAASLASTPQFSARQDIATGFQRLYGMAVADINGDGKPDIVVTDNAVKRVFIYLNDGNGSFGAPKTIDINMTALGPGKIIAGDFNEDSKQDLIIGTVAGLQADLLLLGNGDGTFTQQPDLPGSYGFVKGVPVDINGDQHLDLILGGNGSIFLYLGDGRGNFQLQSFPNQGGSGLFTGVATADFNKDGKLDFVTASPLQVAGIRTFIGNGDGSFASPISLSTTLANAQPGSLAVADFDGDGNPDLLLGANYVTAMFPGKGDGSFDGSKPYYLATADTTSTQDAYGSLVASADMDGDKKIDAVVADDNGQTINILLNDGTGKFPQSTPDFSAAIDHGVAEMALADLNGDGLPDIVIANNVTQNISIFLSIRPKAAVTAVLTSSANPQPVGSSVTFTAKIAGTIGAIPTGTITLLDGTNSLGQQTLDGNAQATFSLSNLSAGQHLLTVSYSGDNNFLPITSSTLTESIADFQMALPTTSQTVTAGGTGTYSLTVTPVGGFTGSISLTCSQLPSLATCDPVTVPVTGQPATATLTVHTTAPVMSHTRSTIRTASLSLFAIAFTALLPLKKRRPIQLFVTAVALVLLGSVAGCSSGSTNSTSNPPTTTTPGTPQGTTQFTITSSLTLGGQTLTRTTMATLVVQ